MTSPLRLAQPQRRALPRHLDEEQLSALAALERADGGHVVVTGEPGAGKTAVVAHAYVRAVTALGMGPERVVVLAQTRASASVLRDLLALAADQAMTQPQVRTPASFAFALMTTDAVQRDEPAPQLLTGADQDALLTSLLGGHREGIGRRPDWSEVVPEEATVLPGFRAQLRDLLMRAAEARLTPVDLAALGQRTQRPEWVAAAQVYQEYLDVLALRSMPGDQGTRADPAAMVADAAELLETWRERHTVAPPGIDLVIVDDAHDMTAATLSLLRACVSHGARVMAVGNADQAVQGFRGAVPHALAEIVGGALGDGALTHVRLGTQYRWGGAVAQVARHIRDRIGVTTVASARPETAHGAADGATADVMVAPHAVSQARSVARYLRAMRHGHPDGVIPWSQMAVIARSRAQLQELRQHLAACDIPLATVSEATALHHVPAVTPLLTVMEVAITGQVDPEAAAGLLTSRYGGLDAVGLRRLRRALLKRDRDQQGTSTSQQLLVELVMGRSGWQDLTVPEVEQARATARAIAAASTAASSSEATAGEVMWAAWDGWGRAQVMREAALAGSTRDDADLDAVVALFKAAQTFAEKLPQAGLGEFADYLTSQAFAIDTLGQQGAVEDVVALCTPVTAAGREWDVVVVAGVDHGLWPNTALRDTVLGAGHLAEITAGVVDVVPLSDAVRLERAARSRHEVLQDETRALYVALSRARRHVLVCGVSDLQRPVSRFVEAVAAAPSVGRWPRDRASHLADERDAVARLRHDLHTSGSEDAARGLATLARMGVSEADPRQWHGAQDWSSDAPMWGEDQLVPVSPSKVDAVEECALRAALVGAGGGGASHPSQGVGTLVHQVAAEHPQGGLETMVEMLREQWHHLELGDTQSARVLRRDAEQMLSRLDDYLRDHASPQVLVEHAIEVTIGRAKLLGQADRIEISQGAARIVDLKTGKEAPSQAQTEEQGQLAMYQLAVLEGALPEVTETAGGALVFVNPSWAKYTERTQSRIDPDQQRERLAAVAQTMAGAEFVAQPGSYCGRCPVRRSCPAQPAGRQVSDR